MFWCASQLELKLVASLAEAWIEIDKIVGRRAETASPPSRRRGLKFYNVGKEGRCQSSPPSRRRGLKLLNPFNNVILEIVASLAEAWIEIDKCPHTSHLYLVASLAEAWIEIWIGCGDGIGSTVASLAEAWIEMCLYHKAGSGNLSPPSRRRGLK